MDTSEDRMESFEKQLEIMMNIIKMQKDQIDYLLEKVMYPKLVKRDMYGVHNEYSWFEDSPCLIFSNEITNFSTIANFSIIANNCVWTECNWALSALRQWGVSFQLQVSQNGLVEWKCKNRNTNQTVNHRGTNNTIFSFSCNLDKRITCDMLDAITTFFERIDLTEYKKMDESEMIKISFLLKNTVGF